MPAATLDLNGNLIIEQGSYWEVLIRASGDLTGSFLRGQIRQAIGGELVGQFQFSEFAYDEETNRSTAKMFLRSGTTLLLAIPEPPAFWVYDVLLSRRGEDPVRILQGRVFISPGVTK